MGIETSHWQSTLSVSSARVPYIACDDTHWRLERQYRYLRVSVSFWSLGVYASCTSCLTIGLLSLSLNHRSPKYQTISHLSCRQACMGFSRKNQWNAKLYQCWSFYINPSWISVCFAARVTMTPCSISSYLSQAWSPLNSTGNWPNPLTTCGWPFLYLERPRFPELNISG